MSILSYPFPLPPSILTLPPSLPPLSLLPSPSLYTYLSFVHLPPPTLSTISPSLPPLPPLLPPPTPPLSLSLSFVRTSSHSILFFLPILPSLHIFCRCCSRCPLGTVRTSSSVFLVVNQQRYHCLPCRLRSGHTSSAGPSPPGYVWTRMLAYPWTRRSRTFSGETKSYHISHHIVVMSLSPASHVTCHCHQRHTSLSPVLHVTCHRHQQTRVSVFKLKPVSDTQLTSSAAC